MKLFIRKSLLKKQPILEEPRSLEGTEKSKQRQCRWDMGNQDGGGVSGGPIRLSSSCLYLTLPECLSVKSFFIPFPSPEQCKKLVQRSGTSKIA